MWNIIQLAHTPYRSCFRLWLSVNFGTAEAWEDNRNSSGRYRRPVQFSQNVYCQGAITDRSFNNVGVWRRCDEVAAHGEEHLQTAVSHRRDALDRVVPVLFRGRESKFPFKIFAKNRIHFFPNTHSPVALHIRMSSDRAQSSAETADRAA